MAEKMSFHERVDAAGAFMKELDRICADAKRGGNDPTADVDALVKKHGGPRAVLQLLDSVIGTAHEMQMVIGLSALHHFVNRMQMAEAMGGKGNLTREDMRA